MRDFRDAKAMAHALRDGLKAKTAEITHSECLELIAKAFGCENWNVLSAKIEATQSPVPERRAHDPRFKKVLSCSFCGKTQHEVEELIAGPPSMFVCDECVGLCNDILDDKEFSRLLETDEERGDRSYPAALEYLRGKPSDQLTRYVERRKKGAERWRLELQQVKRTLAMRDDEVVPETDVLATPRFAFLKNMTREGLHAFQHQLERRLERYEDAQPIVTTVVSEHRL
jgi:hypothetical protein